MIERNLMESGKEYELKLCNWGGEETDIDFYYFNTNFIEEASEPVLDKLIKFCVFLDFICCSNEEFKEINLI